MVRRHLSVILSFLTISSLALMGMQPASASAPVYYDISTLAGKVASVNGASRLGIRFSAFIEQEAEVEDSYAGPAPATPITPSYVLSSPLDGDTVLPPDVTVNQDTAAAPQNETAIAVDPNNPNRVVAAANDYVTRTWPCQVDGTPCSALGDGYSGTYFSNDGGQSWCCSSSDPSQLGTLIPGVTRLTGGQYDAGGDPSVAFDSQGNVYYAGLGFDRTAPPNTVAVNKGTFDSAGKLTWGLPTFINQTTSPAQLNDKEWINVDWHAGSPYQDRVYVSWTRFIFNPVSGAYVQSPIFFAYSSDGGTTFSTPTAISGNVLYGQGSRPVVGYDGTVYVFWDGATRRAALDSIYMVKSTDGGQTWSKPAVVSTVADIIPPADTVFRVNSFPAADAAPNGDLYVAWSAEVLNSTSAFDGTSECASWLTSPAQVATNCHAAAVWSMSADGGANWSDPAPIFPALDGATRTAEGYPVTQADGTELTAPDPRPVDTFWPDVAISPTGRVYMSAYAADVVSPWQTCAEPEAGVVGRIDCLELGDYIDNARLDYYVANISDNTSGMVTTHPINTRHGFGGGFIGDYTGLAVGSDNTFHALWTDTNNKQDVVWWYGYEFVPTPINQQDVVTASGSF